MKRQFKHLTKKQKDALKNLLHFGRRIDTFLACVSSEFSEGDEKEFKANYGVSFAEAGLLVEVFRKELEQQLN